MLVLNFQEWNGNILSKGMKLREYTKGVEIYEFRQAKSLQSVVFKEVHLQLLQNHKVKYVPGWDCHGLPIELKGRRKRVYQRFDPSIHISHQ
nr:Isoleucine--tRNA ligase chloroplastic/mitochondrial [Ipomoea batatas]